MENDRKVGKQLSKEIGKKPVLVYRAVAKGVNTFSDMDYVTLSKRFAVEHAENNHIYNDEQQQVIVAFISSENIYDAYNPGEYFYVGKSVPGKILYLTKGEEFEGYEELKSYDFLRENVLRAIIRHQLINEEIDELQNHIFAWLDSKLSEENITKSSYKTPSGTQTIISLNNDIIFSFNFNKENTTVEVNDDVLKKLEKYFFTNQSESYDYLKSWIISRYKIHNIDSIAPYKQVKYNDDVGPEIDYSKY